MLLFTFSFLFTLVGVRAGEYRWGKHWCCGRNAINKGREERRQHNTGHPTTRQEAHRDLKGWGRPGTKDQDLKTLRQKPEDQDLKTKTLRLKPEDQNLNTKTLRPRPEDLKARERPEDQDPKNTEQTKNWWVDQDLRTREQAETLRPSKTLRAEETLRAEDRQEIVRKFSTTSGK